MRRTSLRNSIWPLLIFEAMFRLPKKLVFVGSSPVYPFLIQTSCGASSPIFGGSGDTEIEKLRSDIFEIAAGCKDETDITTDVGEESTPLRIRIVASTDSFTD
jgi:hypothetical protein